MGARTTSGPVHPGVRGPPRPVGRELFAHNLPHDVEGRPPVDVLEQRVIDQRLVVAAASLVDHVPEILKYTVVEANRDLRSEEHTSELQSLAYLVCRLLLEKKKNKKNAY